MKVLEQKILLIEKIFQSPYRKYTDKNTLYEENIHHPILIRENISSILK
jgi:hypothetical protein